MTIIQKLTKNGFTLNEAKMISGIVKGNKTITESSTASPIFVSKANYQWKTENSVSVTWKTSRPTESILLYVDKVNGVNVGKIKKVEGSTISHVVTVDGVKQPSDENFVCAIVATKETMIKEGVHEGVLMVRSELFPNYYGRFTEDEWNEYTDDSKLTQSNAPMKFLKACETANVYGAILNHWDGDITYAVVAPISKTAAINKAMDRKEFRKWLSGADNDDRTFALIEDTGGDIVVIYNEDTFECDAKTLKSYGIKWPKRCL